MLSMFVHKIVGLKFITFNIYFTRIYLSLNKLECLIKLFPILL